MSQNLKEFRSVEKIRKKVAWALQELDKARALYDVYLFDKDDDFAKHCAHEANEYMRSAKANCEWAVYGFESSYRGKFDD